MSYIQIKDYSHLRARPNILTAYLDEMVRYLKLKYPDQPEYKISEFVKKTIKEKIISPEVEAVYHKTEGNSQVIKMSLINYISEIIKDNNLSPSGTCYYPVTKKESFICTTIEDKVKARNSLKKLYLEYEAQGKKKESQYYNQGQANAKIFNNAIPGGMKIKQFILGCKAGFNAITSTGRMSVKQGYSFIERAINGNIYLPTDDAAISYILVNSKNIHSEFSGMLKTYNLYIPTVDEVVSYLTNSVSNYVLYPASDKYKELISSLPTEERAYVFYTGCLNNLCTYNESFMKNWIDSIFYQGEVPYDLYKDIDVSEVKSFKDDVITCMLTVNYKLLGMHPKKKDAWNSIKDALKFNPDGVKKFIYVTRHFITNFETMLGVLRPILQVNNTFSKLVFQQKMARYTVPLSDTDSNIFSLQELVKWRNNKLDFSKASYEMSALLTFLLSQTLEHIFARLSAGIGCEGKNMYRINMKNEFLYPIMITTSLAKHYLALATMQEGSLLAVPRQDFKGIGLRSSVYPKLVRDGFNKFVVDLFKEIEKAEPIMAAHVLDHVANVEKTIFDSVNRRESTYLQTVSIKREEDYKDPAISSYFYYGMWNEVFAEEFGEMQLPNKCFKIPLKFDDKFFKNEDMINHLKVKYPVTMEKWLSFVAKFPDRDIATVLIPPFKGMLPEFFLEIMNLRSHISQSVRPYYILLEGLGIGTIDNRRDALVTDFYNPTSELIN
jgi:hypothetical protein